MPVYLKDIFPCSSIDGVGFLFGAGASKEAGYPLISDLTKNVLSSLDKSATALLLETLEKERLVHDLKNGIPDIETLADVVIKHQIAFSSMELAALSEKLRTSIASQIENVSKPDLSHHISFLSSLKRRCSGTAATIWIFTTNYDPLFELAASKAQIRMCNGFQGTLTRYYCPDIYNKLSGEIASGNRFRPSSELTIMLVKLHGSIYWRRQGTGIEESLSVKDTPLPDRVIILPRKLKVMDTLTSPYDELFQYSSTVLGSKCKYLACSGFGFNDQHIFDHLLKPKLNSGKLRVFATFGEEIDGRKDLIGICGFNYCTPTKLYIDGLATDETNEFWKFSEYIKLFN